jgi:hypothetical protein
MKIVKKKLKNNFFYLHDIKVVNILATKNIIL